MRKLLWVGDAAVATGFARATHHTLDVLRETWEIHVLGLNYLGDPHTFPYAIYPCWPGGDLFGVGRIKDVYQHVKPDLVLIQNDPWNIKEYLDQIPKEDRPLFVASLPVDGKNCRGEMLNDLNLGIFWTEFGRREANRGGFYKSSTVIPLGVDLLVYRGVDRQEARRQVGIDVPEGAFIIGNVNRNQPRKRLDLTIQYFAEWVNNFSIDDAFLFLHVAPTGENEFDVQQLMSYYGLSGEKKRLILSKPHIGHGVEEKNMPLIYSCFDVQLTTTQGEGFGLTTLEGMACGIPQIVPDWSALGEWTQDAVKKIPCTTQAVTPNRINVIGGIADREQTIRALDTLYRHPMERERLSQAGIDLARRPEFRWPSIGSRFAEVLDDLMRTQRPRGGFYSEKPEGYPVRVAETNGEYVENLVPANGTVA